uniref:Uncharacterized protein n=1 Tax=Octopus bimaculoides TaxID=37653 RepID=A0A0L8H2Q7_OCTBM
MEKINEESKMLALIPATGCDTRLVYKETTRIFPQILHTRNTEKTEEQETQNTRKPEEWEMSILPGFLHIVTCYQTIIKTDHINTFIDYVKDECNHMDLDGPCILRKIKRKMQSFLEFTKQNNDFIHQNLDWFQQRLFDIYVTCNPYNHKTIEPPKVITKFRPLCPVVTREAKIEESGEEFDKNILISNIIGIQEGIVTYSHHCMTICCVTRDGDRNDVHCPSSVTSFTRIGQDMVLATLPFQEMILIISPTTFKIKTIQLGFYLASYLEHSTLIGVEMFGKTVYRMDWEENRIKHEFITKETPTDIAVGVQNILLISFSSINRVICYDMDGQQLWEVETHSLDFPSKISLYQSYFFVLQGQIIYRISAKGGVTMRDIGRKCRSISVGKDTILVTDYFGKPHAIQKNEDFWPKLSYNHQLHTPSLKDYIDIEDCNNITNILPMSTSSILIIYRNKKAKLFTDNEEIINQNNLLVVSDINHDCLLYISNEGDIVSRLSLPSTATDICRWDFNQIGVTLPLQKQLRVIGNLSKTVRSVSLGQPYVRVCKMGEGEIVCYCDKPSHLDILAIKCYNEVEIIHRINIPFFVKSLSIEKETEKLLIVTRGKALQYNTRIGGGGRGSACRHLCSFEMTPSVLMSQVKHLPNLYGGSMDQTFVYLIDSSHMFAINDHNLLVNDLVTNNQLNYYIDLVDVFSRNISVSEMLSSSLYLQDLTVSDKGRHIPLSQHLGDKGPVEINRLVITENNLIAGWDEGNRNIKIFTLDGHFLDSIKLNLYKYIKMCRWQSNTLVITNWNDSDNDYQMLTLKVEFPLSLVICQTRNEYQCVASLSNNQLVCSKLGRRDGCHLYFVDIDETHSNVKEIKQMDIPKTLLFRNEDLRIYVNDICEINVIADDVIIVYNLRFIIFFNSDGQYLHSVRHYMKVDGIIDDRMTTADSYFYINGVWDKYVNLTEYHNILCLTQTGEYKRIFLNRRIYKDKIRFSSIDSRGPRFVGSPRRGRNELYVEGLFMVNRERIPVARLQTDEFAVQVKDFDISEEGKTVVCEKANNGTVKIFDEDGELLCHRNVASLVGGVCFTQGKHIMATVPKRKEIFQLNGKDLKNYQVWQSQVPYGVICRKVGNIYWCVHIELIECHCIKIDGDQVKVLESVSLLDLDSGHRFPSITSQMNKEIFTNELINKSKYSEGDGGRSISGEIIGKGRLKVRCGNYIAEGKSGIDEISVRRLPYRTAMVPFSIPAFEEPVNYDLWDSKDWNNKLIKLDDNVSVLMFRESVTLISTTTGDILQHKQLPQQQPPALNIFWWIFEYLKAFFSKQQPQQQQPLDICRWSDEHFIVVFGKEMMVFNRDLRCLKTIKTEKYYNTIYKYNDNQLVCGGHHIRNLPEEKETEQLYYLCKESEANDSYYVDVVDMKDGKCKDEVCRGKKGRWRRIDGDARILDVRVTSSGDVVVMRREVEIDMRADDFCIVEWLREKSLVRRIRIGEKYERGYYIQRPRLSTIGECVYITDRLNNIFQMPEHIEGETSEDIEILSLKNNAKYLLLRTDDNEVFEVLGFDASENSFMVFGIIPGRQSFAFFHYDK